MLKIIIISVILIILGVDECQDIYLGEEDIDTIIETLESVTRDNASEVMPTANGFFFGSTEYDDWYFNEVEYSIKVFKLVKDFVALSYNNSVTYRASW